MPAKETRKANPLANRLSTNVDQKVFKAFRDKAVAAGMTDARYLRQLIEADAGLASAMPAMKRRQMQRMQFDALAHEINQVGLHARKIGVNVNQLAKQANTGMVPLTRAEMVHMMTEMELLASRALAALERVLA